MKRLIFASVLFGISATPALASNLTTFHARADAMGGTGVASARSSAAPIYNPAMLATQPRDADFEILFPSLGIGLGVDKAFFDAYEEIDDEDLVDNFTDSFDAYNNAFNTNVNSGGDFSDLITYGAEVNKNLGLLNDQLKTLDDGKARINASATILTIAFPSEDYGFALSISGSGLAAAKLDYADAATVEHYNDGLSTINNYLATLGAGGTPDPNAPELVDYLDILEIQNGEIVGLADPTLESELEVRSVAVLDAGVSIAREFKFKSHDIAIGITPKSQKVITYAVKQKVVEDGDNNLDDVSDEFQDTRIEERDFNLDVGATWQKDNWVAGASIRNLLGHEYDLPLGDTYKLSPHLRVGGAYTKGLYTLVADLDLTEQDGLFKGQETQYAAFGAEFNFWEILQLRGGYRHNLSDSDDRIVTFGLGLSPAGVMLEFAAFGNIDDFKRSAGVDLQLGYRF